jgi:hypothetical protein
MNERALKNIKKLDLLIAAAAKRAATILRVAELDCDTSFLAAVGSIDGLVRSRNALADRLPAGLREEDKTE